MENQFFQQSKNAITKPYKNLGRMKEIWSRMRKRASNSLEKHCLEQLFATRNRRVVKPYKTNGKAYFWELQNPKRRILGSGSRQKEERRKKKEKRRKKKEERILLASFFFSQSLIGAMLTPRYLAGIWRNGCVL